MDFPDLDFLGDKKPLVIAGAVGLIAVFAYGRSQGKQQPVTRESPTLVPPAGTTWEQLVGARHTGTPGYVGPGEPVPGDSAYEIAVKSGFRGTLDDWLKSLQGATGAKGATGATGAKGADGKPAPVPTPPKVTPPKVTPPKSGWQPKGYPREIDPTGKPYTCKAGYYMGMESTGSGHHVCIKIGGTQEIQVTYKNAAGAVESPNPGGSIRAFDPVPAPIPSSPMITVQPGDTLKSLAARGFGSPEWWELLRMLNPGKQEPVVGDRWRL